MKVTPAILRAPKLVNVCPEVAEQSLRSPNLAKLDDAWAELLKCWPVLANIWTRLG